ncbi:MAG: hypothetical protein FK734_03325 [Asgard group archaeon]|nr:hypothetical protein [Asgard group archaeon]
MDEANKLFDTLKEECTAGNFSNVEQQLQELAELAQESNDAIEIYSNAVVIALETFEGRFSSTKVKKYLSSIEEFCQKNPENKALIFNFAKTLRTSLKALSSKGQPNLMEEIIANLENLAIKNPDDIKIHEELSKASYEISNFWKKRGDFKALKNRTKRFRELAEKFPDNEEIKLNLSKSLILEIDSSNKRDIKNIDNIISEIQILSESMPQNIGLQLEWVHAYLTAMDRSFEEPEDAKRWLESIKKIVANQKDSTFKIELAKGYLNAISALGEQNHEEMKKQLDELELLADSAKDSLELQTIYAQSLFTTLKITGISDYNLTQEIMSELQELAINFPKNDVILKIYVESLVGVISLLAQEQKGEEIIPLLNQLEELDKKYPENEFIQQIFDQISDILKMIGFKRETKKPKRMDYV